MKKKTNIWILPDPEIHIFWHFCVAACRCFLTSASFTLSNKAEPAFYTQPVVQGRAPCSAFTVCVCLCPTDWFSTCLHSHRLLSSIIQFVSWASPSLCPTVALFVSLLLIALLCARVCLCTLCVCRCVSTHSFLFRPTVLGVLDCIWLNRNWISWQRQNEQRVNQQENITDSHFLPSDINRTGNWETRALTSPLTPSHNEPLFLRSDGLIFTL